jgi:hypothetical protein
LRSNNAHVSNEHAHFEERLKVVVEELARTGRVGAAELAQDTGTAEMTIRRDLGLPQSRDCSAGSAGNSVCS